MMILPYVAILLFAGLFTTGRSEDEEILTKVLQRVSDQDQRITKLEEENHRQADQLTELTAENEQQRNMIQRQNEQLAELKVSRHTEFKGFHATSSSGGTLINGQTLVFDEVEVNAGNSYNAATGQYTCPELGYYLFATSSATSSVGAGWSMVLDGNVISGSMACCDNIDAGSMTAIVQCGGGSVVEPTMPPKTTPVQASPGSIIRAFEDDYKNKPAFWKDPLVLLKLSQIGVITDKKRNDLKNANSSGDCVCAAIMKDLRKWNCTMKEAKKFADLFKENYTSLYERMIVAFDTKQGDIAMQSVPDPIKSLIEKKDHDVRPRTSYGTRRSHGGGGVRPQTGRARTPQSPAEDEMVKAYVVKVAATNKVLAKTSDKVKEQEEIIEQYQVALQEYENKPTPINEEMSKWKMEFEELRSKYKEEKEENIKLKSKMAESEELVQNYKDENRQLRNECTINEDKLQQKDEALKKTQQELDHATQKVEYYKQLYVDMKCKVEALKDENAEMKHRLMKLENMMNRKSQQQEKLEFRMNALGLNRQLEFFNHSEKHVVRFLPEIPMMRK